MLLTESFFMSIYVGGRAMNLRNKTCLNNTTQNNEIKAIGDSLLYVSESYMFLLSVTFSFPDPLPVGEGIEVDFASTFFESSLALLKVGCMVFGANDGDDDDESGYDTNENTLDLRRVQKLTSRSS